MNDDVLQEIRKFVRMGVHSEDRIREIFCGERYSPGELDPKAVEKALQEALAAHQREQESWPDVTDVTRLRDVFDTLNGKGILALEDLGFDHNEGYHLLHERYEGLSDQAGITGFCFFHEQDVERVVDERSLLLSFGSIDPEREDDDGPAVGKAIVEELVRAGFTVEWDGSVEERIAIPGFDWKRRR